MSELTMNNGSPDDPWDGELYRNACSFVPSFGDELIDWLDPMDHERILDVGCGTGEITAKIGESKCEVVGIDKSESMLEEARKEYPHISFVQGDIKEYHTKKPFDGIFSNAVLHWIQDSKEAISAIYRNLESGGRFVGELGVEGNVGTIRDVLHQVVSSEGYNPDELDPWFFPSPESYKELLEGVGFSVTQSKKLERSTEVFGEEGLNLWLTMFAENFFVPFNGDKRREVIKEATDRLSDKIRQDGRWILTYNRLRFRAVR